MADAADFRRIALSFDGASEYPHFDRRAFRARVTFATLAPDERTANLKFTPDEQALKCAVAPAAFSPIPNAWGRRGWTCAKLAALTERELQAALEHRVASRRRQARPARRRAVTPPLRHSHGPAIASLASQSFLAAASSRAAAEGSTALRLTK